jgi:hypothetical protein
MQEACPDCGAALERDQRYCVECGAPVGVDYRPHPSWRLPAAIVAVVVLLAGAGLAFALTEISRDSNADSARPAPTQVAIPVQPKAPAPADSGGTATKGDGQLAEWPAGKEAFTVILFSTDSQAGAEKKAREAATQGIPAGALKSDDYSSLRAGYWVVFAGQFDTRAQAEKEAESYASLGFADGYPRFVKK